MTTQESQQFARAALIVVGDETQDAAFRFGFAKGALVALAGLTEMPEARPTPPDTAPLDAHKCEECREIYLAATMHRDPNHGGWVCSACYADSPNGRADARSDAEEHAWEAREGK